MKTIILGLLLFISANAQPWKQIIFWGTDFQGIYDGTELLATEIDRTFEMGANLNADNQTFTSNVTGYGQSGSVTFWYNTDWNGVGRINTLLDSATTSTAQITKSIVMAANKTYRMEFKYYIPNANAKTKAIRPRYIGGSNPFLPITTALNTWTRYINLSYQTSAYTALYFYQSDAATVITAITTGDKFYMDDIYVNVAPNWLPLGNHTIDTTTVYKQAGTFGSAIIASGAGNGTTNTTSLASERFTAVTAGKNYRFQVYAYTSTASTTLTFKLGDIVLTNTVSTVGMSVLNFDFKATASTTGGILLYLDKAATVYLDGATLKEGR